MSGDLLIRSAEVEGRPGLDVRVAGGRIAEIGIGLRGTEPDLDAAGGTLIPGLIDHHIHLMALAAQRASLKLGPADVTGARGFHAALQAADEAAAAGAWLRGVGYHESVAGDLDRTVLDAIVPHRPLRIQHRTGGLWMLNSAALATVGAAAAGADGIERDTAGQPTGRIWRGDAWLRGRLPAEPPSLAQVGRELAALGIVGVTDASVSNDAAQAAIFAAARAAGDLPQKLMLMGGGVLPPSPTYRVGPVKILLDDDGLGDLDGMAASIAFARSQRRAVAIHCVTAAQLAVTLAAFDAAEARPGDRIEHGGIIDADARGEIARLGLAVVTQPGFVAERGDQYRAELPPDELAALYPCASLIRAGIPVAGSSDAPYTDPDPWAGMAAAMRRITPSGVMLGAEERVDGDTALNLYLGDFEDPGGPPRRIKVGAPADLCLLGTPLSKALASPSRDAVRATIIDGDVVHEAAV
jgi:predicted amidohydrolase YtcJ